MYKIAIVQDDEREVLFLNTASKIGMNAAIVEKDFWVCLILDYLFHKCKYRDAFAFKGGTSLSKAYNLIDRFSEDIDLILDWRLLGYTANEPWMPRSNAKQQKFIDDSRDRLFFFIANEFMAEFKKDITSLLGHDVNVFVAEDDSGTVNFEYPSAFQDRSILKVIRLEIGALAAWNPTQKSLVTSYAAQQYPTIFKQTDTEILTTTASRSFWEKATILHQEAFRSEGSKLPDRYSRHYYDLYCIAKSTIITDALAQPELLEKVAKFKQKFYPRNWARYDLARVGTIRLVPAKHSITALRADYAKMRAMIYGDYPSFEELMDGIRKLEQEINGYD